MRKTIGTYGTMTDVVIALQDFAGQENCDGPEYDAMMVAAEEIKALRRALDLLGVPAQAAKDPDKAPPLRIDVRLAQRAMEVVDG